MLRLTPGYFFQYVHREDIKKLNRTHSNTEQSTLSNSLNNLSQLQKTTEDGQSNANLMPSVRDHVPQSSHGKLLGLSHVVRRFKAKQTPCTNLFSVTSAEVKLN